EEGHELCAEGLDVSVEDQLHGAPGEENSKDNCYLQNENTILMMRKLQSLTREPRGGRGPQWQGVLRYSQCMFSLIGLDPSRRCPVPAKNLLGSSARSSDRSRQRSS